MNTIRSKASQYFAHHLKARIRLSPPPRSALEAAFILDCFRTLGLVEYFHIAKTTCNFSGWSPDVDIIFNPSQQQSQIELAIFRPPPSSNDSTWESTTALELRRNLLKDKLRGAIALPRFSYIEGDTDYANGRSEIRFNHRLLVEGLKFDGQYSVTHATIDNPLCFIEPVSSASDLNMDGLRHFVRHNRQKFHKIHKITLEEVTANLGERLQDGINHEKLMIVA